MEAEGQARRVAAAAAAVRLEAAGQARRAATAIEAAARLEAQARQSPEVALRLLDFWLLAPSSHASGVLATAAP